MDHLPLIHSEYRSPNRLYPLLQSYRIILPLKSGVTKPLTTFGGVQVRTRPLPPVDAALF
jgi:hypothetical protein